MFFLLCRPIGVWYQSSYPFRTHSPSLYPFTDRSAQRRFKSNTPNAVCWTKRARCVYIWFYFYQLRTHEELIKGPLPPCCSMLPSAHFVLDTPLVPRYQIMSRSVTSCHYILFLVRLEVFGPCCVHISFETTPESQTACSDGNVHTYSNEPH